MMNDIRNKHKAPRGWFGHMTLIILGLFLLSQPWFPNLKLWPVILILIPIILMIISHIKQQRRKKRIEAVKKAAAGH